MKALLNGRGLHGKKEENLMKIIKKLYQKDC